MRAFKLQAGRMQGVFWFQERGYMGISGCRQAVHIGCLDCRYTGQVIWAARLVTVSLIMTHHIPKGLLLLHRPNALEPTLVGTKLLFPMPPERLRKSARRWVTHVAVLQARFCAVMLIQRGRHRESRMLIDSCHHVQRLSHYWKKLRENITCILYNGLLKY